MKNIIANSLKAAGDKDRKKFLVLATMDVLVNLLDIASIVILLMVLHVYTGGSINSQKLEGYIESANPVVLVGFIFLLFAIKNLFAYSIYKKQYKLITGIATRISGRNLLQYLEGTYLDYVRVDTAANARHISYQPLEFSQYVLTGIQQLITQTALIVFTIVAILVYKASLFLILIAILLPPVILVAWLIRRRLRDLRLSAKANSELSLQFLNEALTGFVESNIYHRNTFFLKRYLQYQERFNHQLADSLIIQGLPQRIIEVFAVLGLFVLVVISSTQEGGESLLVTLAAFMAAAYKSIPGIVKILNTNAQMRAYEYTLQSVLRPENLPQPAGRKEDRILSVKMKDLSFGYENKQLLEAFTLEIEPGDMIAIKGKSGKGKTTVMHLLLGFLEQKSGSVIINGEASSAMQRRAWWPRISYVKQEPFLLHDTLLTNITLDEKDHDHERLRNAIVASGLEGLVDESPEKLMKLVAEDGKNISGGQRQRIAIARAIYKDADLIILDEPFNELDSTAEESIITWFRGEAAKGKMIILISHNQQTIACCNKQITIDE